MYICEFQILKAEANSKKYCRNGAPKTVSKKSIKPLCAVRNNLPKKQKRDDSSKDLSSLAKQIILETIGKHKNLLVNLAFRDYLYLLNELGLLDVIEIEIREPVDIMGLIRDLHPNSDNKYTDKEISLKQMVREYENEQKLNKFEQEFNRRKQMEETAQWLINKKTSKPSAIRKKTKRTRTYRKKHRDLHLDEIYAKHNNMRDVIHTFNNSRGGIQRGC